MAKELCMIAKTPKGKLVRKYFIEVEKELHKLSPETVDNLSKYFDSALLRNRQITNEMVNQLVKELHMKDDIISQYNQLSHTYCISDIVQIFKELPPWEATYQLVGDGIIVKRLNGYFPDPNYSDSNHIIGVTDKDGRAYCRFTEKGIVKHFYEKGYQLKLTGV